MAKFKPRPMGEKLNRDTLFGTSLDLPRVIEVSLAELHPNELSTQAPSAAWPLDKSRSGWWAFA